MEPTNPSASSSISTPPNQSTNSILDPAIQQQILAKKCKIHPKQPCTFLHLNGYSEHTRICFICTQKEMIPSEQMLNIRDLLKATPETYSKSYPVLKDDTLIEKIKSTDGQIQDIQRSIDDYFIQLKEEVILAIEDARNTQLLKLSELKLAQQKTKDILKQTAKIVELQQILAADTTDDDTKLKQFIEKQWANAMENTNKIKDSYQQFEKLKNGFSLEGAQQIQCSIIESLQQIKVLSNSSDIQETDQGAGENKDIEALDLLSSIKFSPSFYFNESPEYTGFGLTYRNEIIMTNNHPNNWAVQCYLTYQIIPEKNLIVRLRLNNAADASPFFCIGLIEESNNCKSCVKESLLSYEENSSGNISKIVKGGQVNSKEGAKQIGEKELEVRINLDKKILKVGSYPDYQNVVELNDTSLIKQNEEYYLAVQIGNKGDSITVFDVLAVDNFDENM